MMFQTENKRIFNVLHKAAERSEYLHHRHASCIVYKGRVISTGINQRKSHTLQKQFSGKETKLFLHSEIAAIVKVINRYGSEILKDCELYNLRLTKGGKVGISKPCAACSKAIETFGIEKVYWT